MKERITSLVNSRIKNIVNLRKSKERKGSRLTIVEGAREISRALESRIILKEIYICPELVKNFDLRSIDHLKIPSFEVTKQVFDKISYGDRDDGILALCEPPCFTFGDLPKKNKQLFIVVENVEKPGNLGAILRTADSAGVDGVIVCDQKTDIYNPNIIRASIGTIFSVKTVVSTNQETLSFLKKSNVQVCSTSPDAKNIYTKSDLSGPLAVVLGSEQLGLSGFWLKNSDLQVKIPMFGKSDSLNVSASAAILIYESIRQRNL